ncbi:methyltransferase, FxLD system [Streptomonospora arabica]|uniref:Protein-L-isoaspartate O-methyltransferase n=1 Tax=Streptomonospora arabica TaxID=412417 RepID=A0ABV9SN67_9ACTN
MTDSEWAKQLRAQVVDELVEGGTITTPQIEDVMRRVERHAFAPDNNLEEIYSTYAAVITKSDEHGIPMSSVSAPQIQAMMLEQARLEPGMRVLEIGSGGYNAALIAELVGPEGDVTTIDIDSQVTARAAQLLAEAGYSQVRVLTADGESGVPSRALFDRILVTAGAWDIPPAWREQLTEKGRLIVPLRMRGLTRSIGFENRGDRLVSDSALVCGFVPMQGSGAHREQLLLVNGTDEIGLRFDDGLPIEPSRLDNAVRSPREEAWTGVSVGRHELIESLPMYLATYLPGFCIMAVDPDLDTGLVAPANRSFAMAAVDTATGDTFGYVTTRRNVDGATAEFGVHALGPRRSHLAAELVDLVHAWNTQQRGGPGPRIEVVPADTPDADLPGPQVIDKRHSRVVLTWPPAGTSADSPTQ